MVHDATKKEGTQPVARLPWGKIWPSYWLGSRTVMNMNDSQRGIYIQILMGYHQYGPLPADPWSLSKLLHLNYHSTVRWLQKYSKLTAILPQDCSKPAANLQQLYSQLAAGGQRSDSCAAAVRQLRDSSLTVPKWDYFQEKSQNSGAWGAGDKSKADKEDRKPDNTTDGSEAPDDSHKENPDEEDLEEETKSEAKTKNPARILAERLWQYQGSPDILKKSGKDWTRKFEVLLSLYPDLPEILAYAFEVDLFWSKHLIRPASDPLGYLEEKLAVPEDSKGSLRGNYLNYCARKESAARKAGKAPSSAPPTAAIPPQPLWPRSKVLAEHVDDAKKYLAVHSGEYTLEEQEEFKWKELM